MKMKYLLTLIIFLNTPFLIAGDNKYPVSDIPENLKKEVNAVVREDKIVFKIISPNKVCWRKIMVVGKNSVRQLRPDSKQLY